MNKVNGFLYGLLSSASFGLIPLFTIPAMQAVVAFLVTASGLTLFGIGSAFWGLIAGGVCYVVLNLIADRNRY